jgi:polar amino acid transport system permease protein
MKSDSSGSAPGPQPNDVVMEEKIRRRGRMGLAISWENIPWWGIIIIIIGVFVFYSALTNTRYVDALRFIFDLPWNKVIAAKGDVAQDGSWSVTASPAMDPGSYKLYADLLDDEGNVVGKSPVYQVEISDQATDKVNPPLPPPGEKPTRINTTTPTVAGTTDVTAATNIVLWDDFSGQPLRVARRMLTANGLLLTLRVTAIAFAGALVIGLIFGLMRVSSRSPNLFVGLWWRLLIGLGLSVLLWLVSPSWRNLQSMALVVVIIEALMFLMPAMPYTISTLYVEVVRGIPMLVIILYMGFAITPALRTATNNAVDLRGLPAAVIGLAFGYGAYLAEVYRAGIQSIPRGQMEAARSLGMNYFQAMRHIVLPQAIRVILPPLGNDFIAMLKDSSLISVIALPEILQQGRLWVSRNFRAFEGYNSVMLVYVVTTLLLSLVVRYIERKSALPGR